MIGTIFTLINQNGDEIKINDHTDPNNLIALQDYPTFDLEIKNQEIQKEGQHGIWDFYSFYGKRLITFSGIIVGEDEAHVVAIQDQLKLVCGLPLEPTSGNEGLITVKYTDPLGRDLQATAKIFSYPRFSRPIREGFKLSFQIVLKSADPTIEAQAATESNGVRGYLAGGITLPTKLSTLSPIVHEQTLSIVNLGNTYANPKITIHGALTNPRIESLTTGKFMALNYTIAAGDYIVLNTADGTIVDQDGVDISGDLVGGSEFIKLISGTNELYLTSDENDTANPIATRIAPTEAYNVEHRDSYL